MSSFSYLEKTLRKFLRNLQNRSISFLDLHICLSCLIGSMRFFFDGITASIPRSCNSLRVSLQSYALSARSFSTPPSSGSKQSIIVFPIGVSEVFPGVSMNERISLILTVKAWILVVSHPLDLQSA